MSDPWLVGKLYATRRLALQPRSIERYYDRTPSRTAHTFAKVSIALGLLASASLALAATRDWT